MEMVGAQARTAVWSPGSATDHRPLSGMHHGLCERRAEDKTHTSVLGLWCKGLPGPMFLIPGSLRIKGCWRLHRLPSCPWGRLSAEQSEPSLP